MIKLNLVSKNLRCEIKQRILCKACKQVGYILILITISISIVFLSAKLILQNNFNSIMEQSVLITKNTKISEIKTSQINEQLNYLEKTQNDFIPWSFLLMELLKNVNNNIEFYLIKVNRKNNEIELRGIAKERNNLIFMKKNIENSDIFSNLIFPIKNILEKENINFEIKMNFNEEEIKKLLF